eukprot:TRINITY_DN68797_c0_g1_i1.p1 TRINITY_DN68797_c0_g1~~TRINITY_DN68797_c0_g1_i1.p1  ORF type:complete len:1140 (+),score=163.24 TRINITY_DN68797_c0_g1_i1:304-3420(+)
MAPQTVFPAMGVLRGMQIMLQMLPMMVSNVAEFFVAKQRVERFLVFAFSSRSTSPASIEGNPTIAPGVIRIENATFAWNAEQSRKAKEFSAVLKIAKGKGKGKGKTNEADFVGERGKDKVSSESNEQPSVSTQGVMTSLCGINLEVKPGELVTIVGPTGSGKTSLLMGMLGEMASTSGSVNISGRMGLAGQEPWICSATVQENILARRPFDYERYASALEASLLGPDLEAFPEGEQTEIGERGINLSGGQKARIALARALYGVNDCDIFVLDDTLSAVDAHVGQAIVEEAVLGVLERKTRIVVLNTFLTSVLPHAHRVVVMSGGRIEVQGSVHECLAGSTWLRDIYDEQSAASAADAMKTRRQRSIQNAANSQGTTVFALSKQTGGMRVIEDDKEPGDGKLYKDEERAVGALDLSIYVQFFGELLPTWPLGGVFVLAGLLFSIALAEAFRMSIEIIVMVWVRDDTMDHTVWLGILGGAVLGVIVCGLGRALVFMAACTGVSHRTHAKMIDSIVNASVPLYFDVTPMGRIINLFAKDLDSLDMQLPLFMFEFLQALAYIIGVVGVSVSMSWATLGLLIPVFLLFYLVRRYYSRTSRELKRLESVSRSPILNNFMETMNGLTHLRALGMVTQQAEHFGSCCNTNFKLTFHLRCLGSWLIYRLDLLGVAIIFSTGASCLWVPRTRESAAILGLGITTATGLMGRLHMTVQHSIETENHMTSVQRFKALAVVPREKEVVDGNVVVDETSLASWPSSGGVSFEDVSLRYRPGLPLVLNKISFTCAPAEKVGIVGRTGCGKSSTMLALLRMVEAETGRISIDGVDISQVPLRRLRGKAVSIIPQDPFLFSGTLRDNLDPFHNYSDEDLWSALQRVYLDDAAHGMGGLTCSLSGGAESDKLSVGQRQLLCIARVMLRSSRVVLMDEATANIDMGTDALIQRSVREAFVACTVLTIAHRLETVMSSDRIVVFNAGRVAEEGSPQELLNGGGLFASLAQRLARDDASEISEMSTCASDHCGDHPHAKLNSESVNAVGEVKKVTTMSI